ncbi:MAG: IS630 transposase-related protein [Verrucomicrobiota bacterium]
MKVYSKDLREKIIEALEAGMSQSQATVSFGVHRTTIGKDIEKRARYIINSEEVTFRVNFKHISNKSSNELNKSSELP